MATESDIESSIVMQLKGLGWQPDPLRPERDVFRQAPKSREEKEKLGRLRPDFVLYADSDSGKPTIIIEVKKPNTTLVAGLEKAKEYAALLGAPIVMATDGYRLKTWHMKGLSPLLYNDREIDELFSKELAKRFIDQSIHNSFSSRESIGKKELVQMFKTADNILRGESLSAGIVRFSEFANLMFLKLQLEDGGDINGHTWNDLENKRGSTLLGAIKSMLDYMKREHSSLFEQTKIRSPARLEQLIDILSSFRLSTVRDDIKGMAFESFIHSYTQGAKNDLGQYFTPRHIIKLMVDYLRPQLGEKIYDPFCGTGGMLIECFRYIQQHTENTSENKRILREDTVYGRDNNSVARIAMMNMIMFGDGHSNIEQDNSYGNFGGKKYDIVITNIPFSQETDSVEGYPVAPSSRKNNGDSIGVQHCLACMKDTPDARATIIVPISFLHKGGLEKEREYIAQNFHLEQVVELTPKCFNPYTEQQTAILMLRRSRQKNKTTTYYHVKNDGFTQSGYRVPVAGENDIDRVMEKEGGKEIEVGTTDGWKYKKLEFILRQGEKRLGELADIHPGGSITPKTQLHYTADGKYPIVMVADLAAQHIDYCLDECKEKINDMAVHDKKLREVPVNTIVMPISGKSVLLNHRALLSVPAYLSNTVAGIIAKKGIHPYYLFYWLLHWDAETATYDLGYPGVSLEVLKKIAIPVLGENEQAQIIEGVAKAVELHKKFKKQHRYIMTQHNS